MNKFFEFFKTLFNLTDEQIEQAQLELNNQQKTETDTQNSQENQEKEQKTTETVENVGNTTENTEKEVIEGGDSVNREDYMKIEAELKAVKALLEKTTKERDTEKRSARIKSVEGCLDYDLLTTLLTGVEDKDLDAKIEAIKKEKSYLFKKPETDGFNPATPQNTMGGVEAAFLELNPDIKL